MRQRKQQLEPGITEIPVGTEVLLTKDDGSVIETKTRSAPWQLGHGAWVVSVEGISGGYDLERIARKPVPVS